MKRSGEIFDPDIVKDCSLMGVKEGTDHISNHFRLPLEVRCIHLIYFRQTQLWSPLK